MAQPIWWHIVRAVTFVIFLAGCAVVAGAMLFPLCVTLLYGSYGKAAFIAAVIVALAVALVWPIRRRS